MRVLAAGVTDSGRAKKRNEDALALFPEHGLFVVADGMGGMAAGEVAAQMIVEAVPRTLLNGSSALRSEPERALARALAEVSREIFEQGKSSRTMFGMGAAVVMVFVDDTRATVCHAGDCRVYRLRGGKLELLTEDHTVVDSLIRKGLLSPAQAKTHPLRSQLTRHAGLEELEPEVRTIDVQSGDRLLLCSDGLTKELDDAHIEAVLAQAPDVQKASRQLVNEANDHKGRDNITALVLEFVSEPAGE